MRNRYTYALHIHIHTFLQCHDVHVCVHMYNNAIKLILHRHFVVLLSFFPHLHLHMFFIFFPHRVPNSIEKNVSSIEVSVTNFSFNGAVFYVAMSPVITSSNIMIRSDFCG